MITKMGKKAWDFITQGKLVDEWFDTDTVTINGVVVNRENYGSSTAYNNEKGNPLRFKICERQTTMSPLQSDVNGDLIYRYMFPYRKSMLTLSITDYRDNNVICNPFIYGNSNSDATAQLVFFGASDDPENEDDYWLKGWLKGVWCNGSTEHTVKKDGVRVQELRVYNSKDEEVIIKEMCACVGYLYIMDRTKGPDNVSDSTNMTEAAARFIMIDRTVLDTPLVIPAKSLGSLILK